VELFACSGPGAGEAIAVSILIGYRHAALAAVLLGLGLLLLTLSPKRWLFPAILGALLLLHPAWTVSAIHGDCGIMKRDASRVFTAVSSAALVLQAAGLLVARKRTKDPDPPA